MGLFPSNSGTKQQPQTPPAPKPQEQAPLSQEACPKPQTYNNGTSLGLNILI